MNAGALVFSIAILGSMVAAWAFFMFHGASRDESREDRLARTGQRSFQWILLTLMFPIAVGVVWVVVAAARVVL